MFASEKICSDCKHRKPLEAFHKNGTYPWCKDCVRARNARANKFDLCACGSRKQKKSKSCVKCRPSHHSGQNHNNWKGGRQVLGDGYVRVHRPDNPGASKAGYVFEHRLVMEKHLGRYLLPGENVHHKNGNRSDNRLENLELWIKAQPSGQRVEDKIADALRLLREYRPDLLAVQEENQFL